MNWQLIRPDSEQWLGNVRMVSHFVDNALLATETDLIDLEGIEGTELLTQMVNILLTSMKFPV